MTEFQFNVVIALDKVACVAEQGDAPFLRISILIRYP